MGLGTREVSATESRVRILVVRLDSSPDAVAQDAALDLLDDAERERAAAFAHATDRRRYVLAHALLRRELADVTGVGAASLRILRAPCVSCGGPHGKPVTDGAHFSLSRSGDWAAIAIDPDAAVGIDLEVRASRESLEPLRPTLLAPGESAYDLLRTWVRKEALLKLSGAGLTRSMTTVRADDASVRDLSLPASSGLVGAVAGGTSFTGPSPVAATVRLPLHARTLPESAA
jgi:4'-phosphopantetheinyl transferase